MAFLGRLPTRYKLRGLETKRVLKRAVLGRLPRWIIRRKKHGFGIPVAGWLNDSLREMAGDLLAPSRLAEQGLFNPAYVSRLVREHHSCQRNHRKPLWTLLMFQLWYDRFAPRQAVQPMKEQPTDLAAITRPAPAEW
jgi:asparagine synthase (glutamine-hydrolysing)